MSYYSAKYIFAILTEKQFFITSFSLFKYLSSICYVFFCPYQSMFAITKPSTRGGPVRNESLKDWQDNKLRVCRGHAIQHFSGNLIRKLLSAPALESLCLFVIFMHLHVKGRFLVKPLAFVHFCVIGVSCTWEKLSEMCFLSG